MLVIPGKIPIAIHPFFWVFAAIIGWLMTQSLVGMFIWIGIILISVLVHEMGHATLAIIFKQHPRIELVALGGLTSYEGKNLKFSQQFIIVLFGPLFGFLLAGVATLLLWMNIFHAPIAFGIIKSIQIVNIFWSIINLVPVLPLDGGQLLRIALESKWGVKGFKASLFIGMLISAILALFFFAMQYFLAGALFFLFAFQSFDMFRKSKNLSSSDRSEKNAEKLKKAEMTLQAGNKAEAKMIFEEIRNETKEGILFVAATHYLALIDFEMGEKHEAYNLLLSVKDKLAEDAVCLLHKLAFDEEDYEIVTELSASCFKLAPSKDVALRNARAFAFLNKAKPAGGWLQTAKELGRLNIDLILQEKFFDKVKDDPTFQHFIKK